LATGEFDDGLGWNPDLLLRLGVESRPRISFLLHQLAKAGQAPPSPTMEATASSNLFGADRTFRATHDLTGEVDLYFS